MFPASPALVLLCVGKALVDSQHHSMSHVIMVVGPVLQGFACVFVLTWLSPWTNSQMARKSSGIDAHLMSGLWDLYKNMYENRNVYLYFTDFIMYIKLSIPWSLSRQDLLVGDCTLICEVYHKECSLVATLYCEPRQAQDTYPIRTSDPHMPHNQHQGWLLLTEAEMQQDPIGSW